MISELTVYPDLIQGTPDWLDVRRGLVTASTVGRLITSSAPDPVTIDCPKCDADAEQQCWSLSRKTPTQIKTPHSERVDRASELPAVLRVANNEDSRSLTALLVAERITGWTETTYTNNDMLRGVMCEPIARDAYSQHHAPVTEIGFMRRDGHGWSLGCSPDGLVGDDGMIEIKSPRAKTHLRTILEDDVPAQYVAQCQAALLVSGRKWLDFVSFYGGLPLYTKLVLPDPEWHAAIIAACERFEQTAAEMVAEYEELAAGLPATERVDFDLEITV